MGKILCRSSSVYHMLWDGNWWSSCRRKKPQGTVKNIIFPLQIQNFPLSYYCFIELLHFFFSFLQFIYQLYHPEGSMKLYQFIIICGVVTMLLAQLPSFHSLRHINLISLILCVTYATCLTIGSIYVGKEMKTKWLFGNV